MLESKPKEYGRYWIPTKNMQETENGMSSIGLIHWYIRSCQLGLNGDDMGLNLTDMIAAHSGEGDQDGDDHIVVYGLWVVVTAIFYSSM